MYKKIGFTALVLAAVVLAGCKSGSDSASTVPVYSSTGESSSVSTGSANSTDSASSSVENSSDNPENLTDSTSSSNSTNPESSTAENPAEETDISVVTYDPQSDIKIAFEGLRVTVTGRVTARVISC